ncbi:MAG TPA: glycosyltransferase [Bacteroidales bacterium]|nr:glycosyltransferase [Bacteroidales bacterium]
MNEQRNILISPLEWGLGHATRMIPVARRLADMNHNIYVASGEAHLAIFRSEIPGIKCIAFSGFSPKYSRFLPQYLSLLFKTPLLLWYIISDHHRLRKIIRDYNIDLVISDNRFGLWTSKVKCVYITHLPRIPLPAPFKLLEITGILLHRYVIKKYSLCFIPDLPGEMNLSGRLAHGVKLPSNVQYMGILSRFLTPDNSDNNYVSASPHNTIILSGPEPQRGILKDKLVKQFSEKNITTYILEGRPEAEPQETVSGNIVTVGHLNTADFQTLLKTSNLIISRSGYTTIMDLAAIGRTGLLIPTPGQTEQEYLAEYMAERKWFSFIRQNEIDYGINDEILASEIPAGIASESRQLFEKALIKMLEQDHENCNP